MELKYRKIKDDDTSLIVKWRNNPEVKKNFISREVTNEIHEKWMKENINTGNSVQYIVEDGEVPIGSFFLKDIDILNNSAEFGIFIGEDKYRGSGYGKQIIKDGTRIAFEDLKLHRLFARALEENIASIKSFVSSGYEIEGTARQMIFLDGKYKNIVFMSIINRNQ